jgi:hypothetical protein
MFDSPGVKVRFATGRPTVADAHSSTYSFTVRDYEAPFDQYVAYRATTNLGKTVTSQPALVTSTRPWLIFPGAPGNSQPIRINAVDPLTRTIDRGVFRPAGRREAIVISDRRRSEEGSLTLLSSTQEERNAILELVDLGQVLLLQCPSSLGYDLAYNYLAIGDVVETRPTRILMHPYRYINLPFVVTSRPAELQGSAFTWDDVLAEEGTWDKLKADYGSWTEVLKHREYR